MKKTLCTLAVLGLAACAQAPIARTGDNEWAIGTAGRDTWHTDNSVRLTHERRAANLCNAQDARLQYFEPNPPDGRFHFRCIPPEHSRAEEIAQARVTWVSCLEAAETPVDDMLSDAQTVSLVLATRCEAEFDQLVSLSMKGYRGTPPPESLQAVRRHVSLDVVLRVRAQRRNPAERPPPVVVPPISASMV